MHGSERKTLAKSKATHKTFASPSALAVKAAPKPHLPLQDHLSKTSTLHRRRWLGAGAFVAILIIVLVTWTMNINVPPPTPAAKAFVKTVAAPGLIEPSGGLRNLSFEIPGTIKRIHVEEGQTVSAGQLVAELENSELASQVETARANLEVVEAALRSREYELEAELIRAQKEVAQLDAELRLLVAGARKEELDIARSMVAVSKADLDRAEDDRRRYLDPTGRYDSWSRQLYDQAQRNAEATAARLEAANAQLQQLAAGTRPELIEKACAFLESAQADLKRRDAAKQFELKSARAIVSRSRAEFNVAEARLNKSLLLSPINGTVIWKFMHAGETIDAMKHERVLSVADLSQLRVRASVDEADYPGIRKGQRVKLTAEAFPDRSFGGTVALPGNSAGEKSFNTGEATEKQDVRIVETLITLDNPGSLKMGLRVRAYFELE